MSGSRDEGCEPGTVPVDADVTRHSRIPMSFVLLTLLVGYQGLIDWKHKMQIEELRAGLITCRIALPRLLGNHSTTVVLFNLESCLER